MEYAVNIRGLSKAYKDFSLKDVDILLPKGAIMGLIGENGAGKSTTLKAMLDIVRRDSGGVEILGLDLDTDQQRIKEQIGLCGAKVISMNSWTGYRYPICWAGFTETGTRNCSWITWAVLPCLGRRR